MKNTVLTLVTVAGMFVSQTGAQIVDYRGSGMVVGGGSHNLILRYDGTVWGSDRMRMVNWVLATLLAHGPIQAIRIFCQTRFLWQREGTIRWRSRPTVHCGHGDIILTRN